MLEMRARLLPEPGRWLLFYTREDTVVFCNLLDIMRAGEELG